MVETLGTDPTERPFFASCTVFRSNGQPRPMHSRVTDTFSALYYIKAPSSKVGLSRQLFYGQGSQHWMNHANRNMGADVSHHIPILILFIKVLVLRQVRFIQVEGQWIGKLIGKLLKRRRPVRLGIICVEFHKKAQSARPPRSMMSSIAAALKSKPDCICLCSIRFPISNSRRRYYSIISRRLCTVTVEYASELVLAHAT